MKQYKSESTGVANIAGRYAAALAQAGYRVVLVDLRGHGKSTGWQVSYGKYEMNDLMKLLDHLRANNLCGEQVGVLGISYGATLALHWAAHDSRIKTVVAIAPYDQPDEAMVRFAKELKIPVSESTVRDALEIASKKLELNWTDWSGKTAVQNLKKPILFIAGEHDSICPPNEIDMLKSNSPEGSKFIQVSKANHLAIGYFFHELTDPVTLWFDEYFQDSWKQTSPIVSDTR